MNDVKKGILGSYMQRQDSGRFTSQDICDNLRGMATFKVDEVSEWLYGHGWQLARDDDRMVWVQN